MNFGVQLAQRTRRCKSAIMRGMHKKNISINIKENTF